MSVSFRDIPRLGLVLAAVAAGLTLTACGSLNGSGDRLVESIKPYRITVVQGNVVTREQVAVLRPGMSRIQVRDILGTPLLASVFHADRWDYVFTFRRQGTEPLSRRVTVFFKGDLLERFEADDALPTETEFATSLEGNNRPAKVPVLEATPESLQKFTAPAATAAPQALPPLPPSYPPLEPTSR
jgi:outer membrane protein assembly factor BamE